MQKTNRQTVIYSLKIVGFQNIRSVGVKGNNNPLSWDNETVLKEIVKDSLYQTTIIHFTGFKFTEVKFIVNGEMELLNLENRRVNFEPEAITKYEATFNIAK